MSVCHCELDLLSYFQWGIKELKKSLCAASIALLLSAVTLDRVWCCFEFVHS